MEYHARPTHKRYRSGSARRRLTLRTAGQPEAGDLHVLLERGESMGGAGLRCGDRIVLGWGLNMSRVLPKRPEAWHRTGADLLFWGAIWKGISALLDFRQQFRDLVFPNPEGQNQPSSVHIEPQHWPTVREESVTETADCLGQQEDSSPGK